ncbi:hypothetical protein MLD38_034352 [Melastoma candidum]|uniref:Uncharacterized protein n=1 Tax=Melastoma candidum TaxID=119954 RepID=A0ACB9MCA0_9MYRT|nr:hypothetical protein MLD38_034352 [Melastoma candidum]
MEATGMTKKVAIVGAGISGLLACKHLMEKGFDPVVFEASSHIGGVWFQTMESTKLQTPKHLYQFSDFPWPATVKEMFPDHRQVMEYIASYAEHFGVLPKIKFNSRVTGIDYGLMPGCGNEDDMEGWEQWSGSGKLFSGTRGWNLTIKDASNATTVYRADFVVLCIGMFSDLPRVPEFPPDCGPEAFRGRVLHSMNYAQMEKDLADELVRDKRVAVVGFQKSALDIATEVSMINGNHYPCLVLIRSVYWLLPSYVAAFASGSLNRLTEYMIHKPGEGFFLWLVAILCSPLALEEGSILLKKSSGFAFCEDGLVLEGEANGRVSADVVIFATGWETDMKLADIFSSESFRERITGSSAPLYRDCIHPRIPQLAILGYVDSLSVMFSTEIRSKWLAHYLAGGFALPTIGEMERDVDKWERYAKKYCKDKYRWNRTGTLIQIHCNDLLLRDMGLNPKRKRNFLAELFSSYGPTDYRNV